MQQIYKTHNFLVCMGHLKRYIILYTIIRRSISSYGYTVQIDKNARGYFGKHVINKVYAEYRKK